MPFTTREIESPDPVTRVAAADAALRQPSDDDIGEKMVLNMGPSHPATHGVLRLVLELDGEIITKATPDIGFLHRGDEKIAENMQYNQFVPYTDRLDYLAPASPRRTLEWVDKSAICPRASFRNWKNSSTISDRA